MSKRQNKLETGLIIKEQPRNEYIATDIIEFPSTLLFGMLCMAENTYFQLYVQEASANINILVYGPL